MTASLVRELLSDKRSHTLRRSDRAVLQVLAKIADQDGRLKWDLRVKKLALLTEYGEEAVRKSLRRLSGRDKHFPCRVIGHDPGRGYLSSRFTVALSWDEEPPAFLPRKEEGETAPAVARLVDEEPPEEEHAPPPEEPESEETAVRKARIPSDVLESAAIAGPGFQPRQDVVRQLHPSPSSEWCPAAQRAGKPHAGRRCCGLSNRQIEQRQERERKAAARLADQAKFAEEFGAEAQAARVAAEDAADRLTAARAAIQASKQSRKEAS